MSSDNPFMEGEEGGDTEEEPDEVLEAEPADEDIQEEPLSPTQSTDDSGGLIQPVNIDRVVELYEQFDELKSRLLQSEDLTKIGGNVHVNKSGWRKIATAFNVSVETLGVNVEVEDGVVKARARALASVPNGKQSSAWGVCASNESNHMEKLTDNKNADIDEFMGERSGEAIWVDNAWRRLKPPKEVNEHNIVATAETRAKNRAISDLVGGGEVSAEEMGAEILDI